MKRSSFVLLVGIAGAVLSTGSAWADLQGGTPPASRSQWNTAANVYETSHNGTLREFRVVMTNEFNQEIGTPQIQNGKRGERLCFNFPARPGPHLPGDNFADARNTSRLLRTPLVPASDGPLEQVEEEIPGTSVLDIESLYFDAATNSYVLEGAFDLLRATYGLFSESAVPDLYADANGNGMMDDADVLYSLVDLRTYVQSDQSFAPLQTFSIVNGSVPGNLTGMMFSTTPFTFDPATGFSGTPYTGEAQSLSEHELVPVPEPATLVLCGIALACRTRVRKWVRPSRAA